jgi:hypothetical protein
MSAEGRSSVVLPRRVRVLAVHGAGVGQWLFGEALRARGYAVVECAPEHAVADAKNFEPDVVVYRVGGRAGLVLLTAIRAACARPGAPTAFVIDAPPWTQLHELGEVLERPYALPALLGAIARATGHTERVAC